VSCIAHERETWWILAVLCWVKPILYIFFLSERSQLSRLLSVSNYIQLCNKAGSAIIIISIIDNIIIIFSILFYIFLLGLHSFTIVMFKQATLVFLWMAWKTTTSFRWIQKDTLPSNGNFFCVSSSLSLCVFYWFNLCTLECPKCTIHVLSFLISIKKHFIKHTMSRWCTALFSVLAWHGHVFALSAVLGLRVIFEPFISIKLYVPCKWFITS